MSKSIVIIFLAFLLVPALGFGYTDHAGTLIRDEVWTAAGSPHVLRTTTIVPQGMHLTIEAGAVVAATEEAEFEINGILDVLGSNERRVLITGLDQNQWGGIIFGEGSRAQLNGVTFATSSQWLVRVSNASMVRMCGDSLLYSPVSENAVGLSVAGGHVEISCGVVVSPLPSLYSISLNPIPTVEPIRVVGNTNLPGRNIDVQRGAIGLAQEFALEQNYPNPFNPTTTIRYTVPHLAHVVLTVYDVSGTEVSRLVDADQNEGSYLVTFRASDLPSGIYFYRLQAGGFVDQKRMLLVK